MVKLAGFENQDYASFKENDNFICLALADGVSNEEKSKAGAKIAVDSILDILVEKGNFFFEFDNNTAITIIMEHIIFELKKESCVAGRCVNDYSSTLTAVLIDKRNRNSILVNLGDSIILGKRDNEVNQLSISSCTIYGTCVTTTKNAQAAVYLEVMSLTNYAAVMLLSDGLWKNMVKDKWLRNVGEMVSGDINLDMLQDYIETKDFTDDATAIILLLD